MLRCFPFIVRNVSGRVRFWATNELDCNDFKPPLAEEYRRLAHLYVLAKV